jgi:molybdenum cofactor cytidylyltransferase
MRSFAIIPAAGLGLRMGRHKLLLPWRESTVIQCVLDAWQASRVDRIVVVIRADDHGVQAVCHGDKVRQVVPDQPPPEMKESVRHALDYLAATERPADEDVWLLAPADMPGLTAATIDHLLGAHQPSDPAILVPRFDGRRGHPVLFPWALAAEVQRIAEDAGINELLRRFPCRMLDCQDAFVLEDLDTPEDYARLRGRR